MLNVHYNRSIARVVGDGLIPVCVVCYCGGSCHWCAAIVIVSKSIHVFNTTFVYANCWNNVGWSIIVGDISTIHNCLTDVGGLWLNCFSVVDLRCFTIIGCCCIYRENICVLLCVALILYLIHNFTTFKIKNCIWWYFSNADWITYYFNSKFPDFVSKLSNASSKYSDFGFCLNFNSIMIIIDIVV